VGGGGGGGGGRVECSKTDGEGRCRWRAGDAASRSATAAAAASQSGREGWTPRRRLPGSDRAADGQADQSVRWQHRPATWIDRSDPI